MNNYFSDFISRFGGETLGLTSYSEIPDNENSSPKIAFIALYNPSWAKENDESFEGLSQQILFFITPQTPNNESTRGVSSDNDNKLIREQLNIIGLIRGSCSLLSDFGSSDGPITVRITDGAIIVIEIDDGYFLAISLILNTKRAEKSKICENQLIKVVQRTHTIFELIHRPLVEILPLYGKETLSGILRVHWLKFIENFNFGVENSFGPAKIMWSNRLNQRGFFEFLSEKSYKRSSLRLSESSKREIDGLIYDEAFKPSGYLVANLDPVSTKHSGVVHMNLGAANNLDEKAVIEIYKMFEDVQLSKCLNPEFFSKLSKSEDVYSLLRADWARMSEIIHEQTTDSQDEDEDEEDEEMMAIESNINASTILAMLNPVTLTNSLVVSPIHGTAKGFKKLGLAVTEQIYDAPNWLNKLNYFGQTAESASEEPVDSGKGQNVDGCHHCEQYLVGLVDDVITRFLVHIPTMCKSDETPSREYSLVVFKRNETLVILFYESGMDCLEKCSFYSDLKSYVLLPMSEMIGMAIKDPTMPLSNSISSLPGPIEAALHGSLVDRDRDLTHKQIDSDFFFIIYDTKNFTYQTSLPNLQVIHAGHLDKKLSVLNRVIFHLHDHLITHLLIDTRGRMFERESSIYEQLHKFSSSKHNDWLIYSLRHKEKVIIIIRNSNQKNKTKPPSTPENNYLMNVADKVYGAANLGFLENLGSDVKVWLGGVEKDPVDGRAD